MKRAIIPTVFLAAVALLALYIAGCSNSDNPVTGNSINATPKVVATSPVNGAVGISVNSPISLTFSGPMDTTSVRLGFHFSGGQSMMMWEDSLSHFGGMGHMGGGMGGMDPDDIQHMLNWMDSIQIAGTFQWSQDLDSCRFVPDSALAGGTPYLMFLYGDVMGRNGMMMNMTGLADDSLMYRFSTAQ